MLAISVLGPVELRRDDQQLVVPAGKTTEVLIRLALDSRVIVSADRLIEDLWGVAATATERNTLQAKISKLRRALGDSAVVSGGRLGYTLQVDPSAVDALVVLQIADTARGLLNAGETRAALDLCNNALAMFRSDSVLTDAGDGDWLIPYRVRLEEVRLCLIEDQLAARVELGASDEVLGELERLVVLHPLRERLWELLVTALYRAGRQADALATYQQVRSRLSDELGLDPGPQLQRLEHRILIQDVSLEVSSRPGGRFAPDVLPGNLPSISAEIIGREPELDAMAELLASERLVEIIGPGGVGKTAVAIAVGRKLTRLGAMPGGIWLARLETAATADDVIDTLIAAMNVPGDEAALLERLKGADALVILDNCEHLLNAAAAVAVRLLDAAPRLRILCTTQVRLDVDGEIVFELEPLALDAAVELFSRRATAQRLIDADEAVLDLCRSLDGLPLVIELAAARTKTLSIEEITRRLDDRFTVLSDPASSRSERRRSLRSTIRWSYELLFPDDQRGLWALATFAGGATLPAVEFVLEALDVPAAPAIDVVGRLASRSLVMVDDAAASTPATTRSDRALLHSVRYRLLDSIRAFALEAMTDAGMADRAYRAHAAWFADESRSFTEGVRSRRQAEFLAFARAERANIDIALAWSASHDPLLGLEVVNGFGWAWVVLGDSRGAQRILTALDSASDVGQVPDRAGALLFAAWIEASTGRLDLARDHIAVAMDLADTINDLDLQARCLYYLAYVVSHRGEFRHAMELTERSRALYDGLDRPWDQAANGLFAARAAISAGDQERGVEAAATVDHWLQRVDDPWLHVRREAMVGELARLQHRFDDAVLHIGRAVEASGRLGFAQTEAYQLMSLGRARCQAGDYDAGAATLELAVGKAEATGDVRLAALARVHLGRVLRAAGRLAAARVALETAARWHRGAGGGEQAALGECLLAAMDAADQVPGAEERLRTLLEDARNNGGDAPVEVFSLDALARITAAAGDISAARNLDEEADRRMEGAAHLITAYDRTDAHWHTPSVAENTRG